MYLIESEKKSFGKINLKISKKLYDHHKNSIHVHGPIKLFDQVTKTKSAVFDCKILWKNNLLSASSLQWTVINTKLNALEQTSGDCSIKMLNYSSTSKTLLKNKTILVNRVNVGLNSKLKKVIAKLVDNYLGNSLYHKGTLIAYRESQIWRTMIKKIHNYVKYSISKQLS